MSAFLHSTALWYFIRGSGIVALILLTGVIALGVATWTGWHTRAVPRFVTAALHRNIALLAAAFVGIHVVTSIVDSYVSIRLVDALVPFVGAVHPVALGLGAVAFDLVLALIVTSLLRARLGLRAWRFVHWFAYLAWPVALFHGLLMGTDAYSSWNVVLVVACVLVVLAAAAARLLSPRVAERLA